MTTAMLRRMPAPGIGVTIACWLLTLSMTALASLIPQYNVGVGISDITGPVVEMNMMGYAHPGQINNGIHTRLFSRAFVVEEIAKPGSHFAFVSIDHGMTSQIVKTSVADRLAELYGEDVFSWRNIMISATHTHSGPAGFFQYLLFVITSKGFVKESYDALVQGIVDSIVQAHESRKPGRVYVNTGEVKQASRNRSPLSYLANPEQERARYPSNVDMDMTILKFVREADQQPIGMFSWFPVHGVSMNETNQLTSSDNKGIASLLFEQEMNGPIAMIGKGPFVAAFAQAHEGDVSPNTAGPRCIDTGEPCDNLGSTCSGKVEKCIAFGPGKDMFESTKIIGRYQFSEAKRLFDSASQEVSGPVGFVSQHIDMTDREVDYTSEGKRLQGKTCKQAMGYSFAAGTTDGPGAFDFRQGMKKGTIIWDLVRNLIRKPSPEMVACQAPKPVLLAVGELEFPYQWVPSIVETQMFRLGQVLITGLPGEFTTMSGRRVREAVRAHTPADQQMIVLLAGLTNVYTDYIATYEEYQVQRYEAASTIFGPHTLQAYIDQFVYLTEHLIAGQAVEPGPQPPFFLDKLINLNPPVVYDGHPLGKPFGSVTKQPKPHYNSQEDVVTVEFVTGNPRNNMRLGQTYLTVENKNIKNGDWQVLFTDANWETKFTWYRKSLLDHVLGHSYARVDWTVKSLTNECRPGVYRIGHFGTRKTILSKYTDFQGYSNEFNLSCGAT